MKDTIKAKIGYKIFGATNRIDGTKVKILYDGEDMLFAVDEIKTREWHEEMMKDNEMYFIVEVFTTVKGNQYIYSRDEEIDEDYIVRIKKAG